MTKRDGPYLKCIGPKGADTSAMGTINRLLLGFYRSCDNFRDILDLHPLLGLYALDAIIEHGDAEGAGRGEDFSAG